MPSEFEGTFDANRREWTARKHKILRNYFRVAGEMLKRFNKPLAFIDGFAGANKYGDEEEGSTRIMVEEAERLRERHGTMVTVFACESDASTYKKLCENLATSIQSGLLKALNSAHQLALDSILKQIGEWPAIVFLDPNRPTQMTIQGDIAPWLLRQRTDVLGLYFGQNVFRIVQSAKVVDKTAAVAEELIGLGWSEITSESETYGRFVKDVQMSAPGKYVGLYKLEKRDQHRIAYGIYGVSGHINGYWLLSDAVARDFSRLNELKSLKSQSQLFSDDPEYNEELKRHQLLTTLSRPIVLEASEITAKDLGKQLLEQNRELLFGQFSEKDFGRVLREIKKTETKDGHAKAIYD